MINLVQDQSRNMKNWYNIFYKVYMIQHLAVGNNWMVLKIEEVQKAGYFIL